MTAPQRIASLLPSATEILWKLGLAERVVAVSHECDYPLEAAARPRATKSLIDSAQPSGAIDLEVQSRLAAGASLYELDAELLRRLRPDLIITQAQCDVCAVRLADVEALVRHAPELEATRVLALQPSGMSEVLSDILRIGRGTAAESAAGGLVRELQERIEKVRENTVPLAGKRRPRVVCIEWLNPLMTAGNWVPELVSLAGGEPCLAEAARHSSYVSWEEIQACQPEVIIVAPCGFDLDRTIVEAKTLHKLPGWSDLSAVKAGRVWGVDGNAYFNRSGPRLVDSLEILAHILHPERFANLRAGEPFGSGVRRLVAAFGSHSGDKSPLSRS